MFILNKVFVCWLFWIYLIHQIIFLNVCVINNQRTSIHFVSENWLSFWFAATTLRLNIDNNRHTTKTIIRYGICVWCPKKSGSWPFASVASTQAHFLEVFSLIFDRFFWRLQRNYILWKLVLRNSREACFWQLASW